MRRRAEAGEALPVLELTGVSHRPELAADGQRQQKTAGEEEEREAVLEYVVRWVCEQVR